MKREDFVCVVAMVMALALSWLIDDAAYGQAGGVATPNSNSGGHALTLTLQSSVQLDSTIYHPYTSGTLVYPYFGFYVISGGAQNVNQGWINQTCNVEIDNSGAGYFTWMKYTASATADFYTVRVVVTRVGMGWWRYDFSGQSPLSATWYYSPENAGPYDTPAISGSGFSTVTMTGVPTGHAAGADAPILIQRKGDWESFMVGTDTPGAPNSVAATQPYVASPISPRTDGNPSGTAGNNGPSGPTEFSLDIFKIPKWATSAGTGGVQTITDTGTYVTTLSIPTENSGKWYKDTVKPFLDAVLVACAAWFGFWMIWNELKKAG